jgi:hypothetical protein
MQPEPILRERPLNPLVRALRTTILISAALTVLAFGCNGVEEDQDNVASSTLAAGDCPPDQTASLPEPPNYNIGWNTDKGASLQQCSDELFQEILKAENDCQIYCAVGGCSWNFTYPTATCPDSSCKYLPAPPPPAIWSCVYRGSGVCHCHT